jgi:uncharacterized protein (DUF952 family)
MSQFLYHLARRADWEKAEAGEPYFGSADDLRDGFIHFSTASRSRLRGIGRGNPIIC